MAPDSQRRTQCILVKTGSLRSIVPLHNQIRWKQMDLAQLYLLNDKALNIPSLSSCYEMLVLITQRNAVDNFQV